jgi:hypothetical protein
MNKPRQALRAKAARARGGQSLFRPLQRKAGRAARQGILSLRLHDLEESTCLDAFEMLKHAIFYILDEDKHKKEELQRRKQVQTAMANYSSKV